MKRKILSYFVILLFVLVGSAQAECPPENMIVCTDGKTDSEIRALSDAVGVGSIIVCEGTARQITSYNGSSKFVDGWLQGCTSNPGYNCDVFYGTSMSLRSSQCSGSDWYWHHFSCVTVATPTPEQCEAGCLVVDTDEDGLPDDIDPYPDDSTGFTWHVISYQEDESGNYTYFCMETDRGDIFCYGEEDPNKTTWTTINDQEKESALLLDYLEGEGLESGPLGGGSEPSVDVPITTDPSEYYFESGVGNDGNTQDLDYLADIVENTQKTADNQSVIGDALSNIEKGVNTLNSQMALQGGSYEGPSAGEIGTAVSSAQESSAGTAKEGAEGTINANMPGAGDYPGDYTGEDIPDSVQEETDFENSFTAFFNPGTGSFQDFCSQSGFTITSPSAVYTLDAWGNSIDLDFSPCAPAFSTVGVFFLAFAYLRGIWVILRG